MTLSAASAIHADEQVMRKSNSSSHVSAIVLAPKIPQKGYVGDVYLDVMAPGSFAHAGSLFGFTTTHGAMVTERHFVGLGAGYLRDFSAEEGIIPIYAEGRIYFPSASVHRIYPHIGMRLGGIYATQGGGGVYGTLACGIRVPVSTSLALNVEIGPQVTTKYNRTSYGADFSSDGMHIGFFGRIGLEF